MPAGLGRAPGDPHRSPDTDFPIVCDGSRASARRLASAPKRPSRAPRWGGQVPWVWGGTGQSARVKDVLGVSRVMACGPARPAWQAIAPYPNRTRQRCNWKPTATWRQIIPFWAWPKVLAPSASPQGRGLEAHSCHASPSPSLALPLSLSPYLFRALSPARWLPFARQQQRQLPTPSTLEPRSPMGEDAATKGPMYHPGPIRC